jgi:hypothetical protein
MPSLAGALQVRNKTGGFDLAPRVVDAAGQTGECGVVEPLALPRQHNFPEGSVYARPAHDFAAPHLQHLQLLTAPPAQADLVRARFDPAAVGGGGIGCSTPPALRKSD